MDAVFTINMAFPLKFANGKFSPSMLVKLKSCADCVVVEAAKIIGTPPKRPANTAIDANIKRFIVFIGV